MSERAVSTALSYVLLLGVAIIVVGGISVTAGELLETQQERAVEEELDVIGERVAADIMTADQLTQTESNTREVTVTSDPPRTVSDGRYTITITGDDPTRLVLESPGTGVTVETTVVTTTPISETRLRGGTLEISYGGDELVITNG